MEQRPRPHPGFHPNGATANISYDNYSRPQQTTSVHGAITTYAYANPSGSTLASTTATTNGHWVKTSYDGFGRTVKVESGYGTTTVSTVDTVYDSCACSPLGKLKQVSQPYAAGGTVYTTVYSYDGLGRTTSIALPGGSGTSTYSYTANVVTSTDAAGKTKTFTSDAFGNLTQVTEPNPSGGAAYQTYYTYSMLNQLLQVSMTRGSVTQTRTWVYNSDQRLQSVTHPESGTTSYTYNTDGTVQQKINADNTYVGFTYDGMGRVRTKTDSVTGCATTYYYDSGQTWQANTVGRLAKVEWDKNIGCSQVGASGQPLSFAEYYSYTPGGLTVEKDLQVMNGQTTGPLGALFAQYSYDNEGRVTGTSYGSSTSSITNYFAYDSMGRLQSMTGSSSVTNAT